ncbi:MAG: DNA polymerase I [Bacteroidetes bacterium]|nr:DNA polymerase I [Bacteroidota bacterium]MBL6943838.1 DNA polymerase I [Bacteroidales bacterium]
MGSQKKLFLLDAMALIYRAYFALSKNPRINSKGQNTSAILGFINTLYDILKNQNPTHIGVAFDTKAITFRHENFAEYKANREKMPEDLAASIPYIMKILKGFNIPILMVDGFEADDIIGTLSKKAEAAGFTTYMMTPDKDFGQLVSDNIFMYKPARMGNKPEIWGVYEVCERFGITSPKQLIDILGLWGDASDNIPGVPGIGEKTAIKLISEFDSVENLLNNTDKLKGKQRENVENFSEQALMSKQLATIELDVPIDFNQDDLKREEPNIDYLKKLFDELEFRNFAKRFFTDTSIEDIEKPVQGSLFNNEGNSTEQGSLKNISNTEHNYQLVDTIDKATELGEKLLAEKIISFDTETTGLDPNNSELVGMSFAVKPHEAWYIPIPENFHEAEKIVKVFKPVLESENIIKIGQNIKFDISIMSWYDVKVAGPFFDTMIAHYLLQPDMRHNMDVLSETYLKYKTVSIEELIGKKGKNQLSMRNVDIETVKEYAAEDADITLQLKDVFEPELKKTGTYKLFDETEMPLLPVLASMEAEGIKLDVSALNEFSLLLAQEITKIEIAIFEIAEIEFNISSPKQLGEILFEKLAITGKPKKTKTGQYRTGEDVLTKLIYRHPIVEKILEYRSLTKLKSTYVDALPAIVNQRDGRIHTSFNQAVAATGRLSSNNPNLQNIPIRTEKGREIRKAFIPRNEEFLLLAADYSQVELRIIAHLSKDQGMIDAFKEGLDIHTATAAKVYGVEYNDVTKEMRSRAKTVNFGIIYGISAFGLSERMGIPRGEAADIINNYFEKYPGVKKFMNNTIAFAKEHGWVETILGRRRYLKDINSANAIVRGFAERNAINAPIQGSSADMIKIAMINIYSELTKKGLKTKMILQVHDELVFDLFKNEEKIVRSIVEEKMMNAIKLEVPVVVDINVGKTWLEAH